MVDKRVTGERIKQLRLASNLTLKDMEARSEVSATHVSEIERGLTSPTVGALVRIARALGVPPSLLVQPARESRAGVVRRDGRCRLEDPTTGVGLEVLSGGGDELTLVEITVAPRSGEARLPLVAGEVFLHVIEGAVDVVRGRERQPLGEGDSLHEAADGHLAVVNPGGARARILCATVPAIRL